MSKATKEQEKAIRAVGRRCRGPLPAKAAKKVKELLAQGRVEEARGLDRVSRKPCGYDFNEIILAGPMDGKRHEYTCPECGVTGTYTAPKF